MIENVETALEKACSKTGALIRDYTGAPVYMEGKNSGAHEWVIEFTRAPDNLDNFTLVFDKTLQEVNSDYEAKRYNDMTLRSPIIHMATESLFYKWMASRGKLGGQNKVPRLSNDRSYMDPLLELYYTEKAR